MVLICISLTTKEIDNLMFVGNLDIFCEDPVPNINVLLLVGSLCYWFFVLLMF